MSNFASFLAASVTIALIAYLFLRIVPSFKDNEDSFEFEAEDSGGNEKESPQAIRRVFDLPPRRDGVILLTSGSSGAIRDAGLDLAQHGYHVLFGVQTESDRKAFSDFSNRKGVELINFNMHDPSTFADTIYRVRLIKRNLQRPMTGLLVNLVDHLERVKDPLAFDLLEPKDIESVYKTTFSSPMKTVQAFFQLVRHEAKEDAVEPDPDAEETSPQQTPGAWDAGGFRIIVLTKFYPEEKCFLHCMLQKTFVEFVELLSKTNIANNFSTSVIPIIAQRSDYITGARYTLPIIPWELDLSEEDEESESNNGFGNDKGANVGEEGEDEEVASEGSVGDAVAAITHAMGSRNPWSVYPPASSVVVITPPEAPRPPKGAPKRAPRRAPKKPANPYEQYARPKRSAGNGRRPPKRSAPSKKL